MGILKMRMSLLRDYLIAYFGYRYVFGMVCWSWVGLIEMGLIAYFGYGHVFGMVCWSWVGLIEMGLYYYKVIKVDSDGG